MLGECVERLLLEDVLEVPEASRDQLMKALLLVLVIQSRSLSNPLRHSTRRPNLLGRVPISYSREHSISLLELRSLLIRLSLDRLVLSFRLGGVVGIEDILLDRLGKGEGGLSKHRLEGAI